MKTHFKFTILTPEAEILTKEVESVYLTTETGDMMLLPGHAAFSGSITYSPVIVKEGSVEEEYLAYRGVIFFSNVKNEATLLCLRCDLKDRVDYAGLKDYLKLIQERLDKGQDLSSYHVSFLEGEKVALVQQLEDGGK